MCSQVVTGNYMVYTLCSSFSGLGESPVSLFYTPPPPAIPLKAIDLSSLLLRRGHLVRQGPVPLPEMGLGGGLRVLRLSGREGRCLRREAAGEGGRPGSCSLPQCVSECECAR